MVELLSPVGDFDCLKAAVQNGADAVYLGSNLFSARAFAKNFDDTELEKAINYAKLRGVKVHLTLNTLIKDEEFNRALLIAKKAYELGIDAIIVQDLGLATKLIESFPDLDIHASTQMTTANLEQVKNLEKLGFKRVVLSRECSLSEIQNICQNTNMEIEVFVHGALCICYSGQCLLSSMVGGRSGNRGACAQPCRLPYHLVNENDEILDKGYLLSTRDLCSIEFLPKLISYGVTSFKIDGRRKYPTYVATVTRIFRKYIALAIKFNNGEIKEYLIDEQDKNDLLQVFNRGKFSTGHLADEPNKDLVFPQKPNNMGIYLGRILKYNINKGLVTAKLENSLEIGDGISFENETTKYTVSELMQKNTNIKEAISGKTITFGRMKGNIKIGDKIYKITSKNLSTNALNSFSKDFKKTYLYSKIDISLNSKIKVFVNSLDFDIEDSFEYDYIPESAKSAPLSKAKIQEQFNKTLNTCFEFSKIDINLDGDIFIPTSILNDIRRHTIARIEEKILNSFKRFSNVDFSNTISLNKNVKTNSKKAILLNILHLDYDYSKLKTVDKIYIPLNFFTDKSYYNILHTLSKKSKIYIYLPAIIKDRFYDALKLEICKAIEEFDVSGCVLAETSCLNFLKNYNLDLIANYNFNIYNFHTANRVKTLGFSTITLSPELTQNELSNIYFEGKEVIVYGKIPLMTLSYCLLGKSDRCYKICSKFCLKNQKYYLSDRLKVKFRVIANSYPALTTIYNSRNINLSHINVNSLRYDFLDETIDEINKII